MNADILKRAGVDYDRGVKRFVGRTLLYEKALGRFLQDECFARIRSAYEANDLQQLLAGTHELKGVCGNIAIPSLYIHADEIVQMLRRGDFQPEELREAYLQLKNDYNTVHDAIVHASEDTL